ncbi:MAG: metal-dependent hydrolase [Pseudomonadota bacterium]
MSITARFTRPANVDIRIRHPELDLSETPRYWFDHSPAKTHLFNALSSTFPEGEAFFIRSVLHFRKQITDPVLLEEIKKFSGQEGVHSHHHDQHMQLLLDQGYVRLAGVNRIMGKVTRWFNRNFPKYSLAVTLSIEHITAIFGHRLLAHPELFLEPAHPEMKKLWAWHASEELEHKAVAFDVYQAIGGSYWLRVMAMLHVSSGMFLEFFMRSAYMLTKDEEFWKWRNLKESASFAWGRHGVFGPTWREYLKFFRRDFHPWQQDDSGLLLQPQANFSN